jgi:hypothetical protein
MDKEQDQVKDSDQISERYSKVINVKYVMLKDCFITETGVRFSKSELAGAPSDTIKRLYIDRLKNSDMYDYAFAKSTGVARRHKDQAPLKNAAKEIIKNNSMKVDSILLLRVFAAVLAVSASILLFSYTEEYFSKFNGAFRSIAFAAIIIVFNIVAFDIVIFFVISKKKRLAAAVAVLLLVTIPLSMFATIDVSYTSYFASQVKSINVKTEASADLLAQQKDSLDLKMKAMSSAIKVRDDAALNPATPQWYLSQLSSAVSKATNDYNAAYSDYKKTIEATPEAVSNKEVKTLNQDLFGAIEDAWGIPKFKMYFAVNTLPAVFLDIIAPLMGAVAMFLGGDKNGRRDSI